MLSRHKHCWHEAKMYSVCSYSGVGGLETSRMPFEVTDAYAQTTHQFCDSDPKCCFAPSHLGLKLSCSDNSLALFDIFRSSNSIPLLPLIFRQKKGERADVDPFKINYSPSWMVLKLVGICSMLEKEKALEAVWTGFGHSASPHLWEGSPATASSPSLKPGGLGSSCGHSTDSLHLLLLLHCLSLRIYH